MCSQVSMLTKVPPPDIVLCTQIDILEHKEVQLKVSEKRVNGLVQQLEQLQADRARCARTGYNTLCSRSTCDQ